MTTSATRPKAASWWRLTMAAWSHAGLGSALALFARPLLQHDRRPDEAELLAQTPLDEPLVRRLELAAGEQDEGRRGRRRLGAEEDLGLLAAPHGVRVLGDQPAEERV